MAQEQDDAEEMRLWKIREMSRPAKDSAQMMQENSFRISDGGHEMAVSGIPGDRNI